MSFPAAIKKREDGPWKKTIGIVEAVEKWLVYYDGGRQEVSRKVMRRIMKRFSEDFSPKKQVRKFNRDDVSRWAMRAMNEKGLTGRYVRDILKIVKSFFTFAIEEGIMVLNPVQQRRLPNIPIQTVRRIPFTLEQFERVLRVLQSPKYHDYWPTAVHVGYYTGLRISDVAWLRWEFDENGQGSRVNFDDEVLIVYPLKLRTSRQRLEIPMERECYNALLAWKNTRPPSNSPHVFPMMHGHWQANLIDRYFREACDEANLPEHTFHCFRHAFVTRLINAGVDPIIVQSMTGQSMKMIQHYSHVSNAAKFQALEQSRLALHKARLTEMGVRTARPSAIEI